MLFFRHEVVFTQADERAIRDVTYGDEWIINANIPDDLREQTMDLDGPLRSKIIHRILGEEQLQVVYIPSSEVMESTGLGDELAGLDLPPWAEKTKELLQEEYDYDLLELSWIDPAYVAPVYPEGQDGEDFLEEEQQEDRQGGTEGRQQVDEEEGKVETDLLEDGRTSWQNIDEYRPERVEMNEPQEDRPIYLDAVQFIRAQNPDVILLDMGLIVEHFEDEYPTYREVALVTREFLRTLYRSNDRFYTFLLMENSVYDKLGYSERSENLDEYLENLTGQMDHVSVAYLDVEGINKQYRSHELAKLFVGTVPIRFYNK